MWDFLDCSAVECPQFLNENNSKLRLQGLLDKCSALCSNEWAKIRGIQARLTLKENANPVFLKARQIPFKLVPLVDKALEELEKMEVLTKVEHSHWATPIVPILKADGSIRVCGDYKSTVNPKLIIDEYPLPTADELLARLAGGKRFSKINLRQAYLQLELSDNNREILTLNTH